MPGALSSRPIPSLLRSYFVFRACRIPPLVRNARPLLALCSRLVGPSLTSELVRATFFAQFVGGETEDELLPLMARLHALGVGSILDYAAESDVGEAAPSTAAAVAGEAHSAHCLAMSLSAVRSAAAAGGFAAVKVTGLAPPELLQSVTQCMHAHRRAFRALLGLLPPRSGEANSREEREEGPYLTRTLSAQGFEAAVRARCAPAHQPATDAQLRLLPRVFALLDARRRGAVDYLDWCDAARLLGFGSAEDRGAAAVACGFAAPGCGADEAGAGADALLALLLGGGGGALPRAGR